LLLYDGRLFLASEIMNLFCLYTVTKQTDPAYFQLAHAMTVVEI